MKMNVPMPFMRRAMDGLIPSMYGTSTEALNIAKVCWIESGMPLLSGTLSWIPMIFLCCLAIITSFISNIKFPRNIILSRGDSYNDLKIILLFFLR